MLSSLPGSRVSAAIRPAEFAGSENSASREATINLPREDRSAMRPATIGLEGVRRRFVTASRRFRVTPSPDGLPDMRLSTLRTGSGGVPPCLSCTGFRNKEVRRPLPARAWDLADVLPALTLSKETEQGCPATLRGTPVAFDADVFAPARHAVFQLAETAAPPELMRRIIEDINGLRRRAVAAV